MPIRLPLTITHPRSPLTPRWTRLTLLAAVLLALALPARWVVEPAAQTSAAPAARWHALRAFLGTHGASAVTFSTNQGTGGASSYLWTVGLDASNPQPFFGLQGTFQGWAPDGSKVVFTDQVGNLYMVNRDGSNFHQLPISAAPGSNIAWSPDGSKLAFVTYPDDVGIANADGSGFQDLIGQSTPRTPCWGFVVGVSWLNNTTVVFANASPCGDTHGNKLWQGVFSIPITGGSPTTIFLGNAQYPAESPDGTKLAYIGYDSANSVSRIYVGGTSITPTGQDVTVASWSPDSALLVYGTRSDNQIYSIPAGGGTPFDLTAHVSSGWINQVPSFEPASTLPLQIATTSLPNAQAGSPYSATLQATGGATPYTWSVTTGKLPGGLSLDPTTGAISGTPTAGGTFAFTVQVADSSHPQQTQSAQLSIQVGVALSIDSPQAINKPASGTSALLDFAISISAASSQAITVQYAAQDGTARNGTDYQLTPGTVTFPANSTAAQLIAVTVLGGPANNAPLTFKVVLSNAVNATIANGTGTGTIVSLVHVAIASPLPIAKPATGTATLYFAVSISTAPAQAITVHYAAQGGTARNGTDYQLTPGTVTFPANSTAVQPIAVTILGGPPNPTPLTFIVELTSATNAIIDVADAKGVIVGYQRSLTATPATNVAQGATVSFAGTNWNPQGGAIQVAWDNHVDPPTTKTIAATGTFVGTESADYGHPNSDPSAACSGTLSAAQDGVTRHVDVTGHAYAVALAARDISVTQQSGPLKAPDFLCANTQPAPTGATSILFLDMLDGGAPSTIFPGRRQPLQAAFFAVSQPGQTLSGPPVPAAGYTDHGAEAYHLQLAHGASFCVPVDSFDSTVGSMTIPSEGQRPNGAIGHCVTSAPNGTGYDVVGMTNVCAGHDFQPGGTFTGDIVINETTCYRGNVTIDGTLDFNGGILAVEGTLVVKGAVTGKGMMIVNGGTAIGGGLSLQPIQEQQIVAGGDVIISRPSRRRGAP